MYTCTNYKTKKALKDAFLAGKRIEVFQPNSDITGFAVPLNGRVTLEGPHYPEPHRWYAQAVIQDGAIVKVS